MDTHVKRGEVHLQHHKHSQKWKRYWLTLYPNSRQGVARLELTETVSDRSPVLVRRQPERKIVRLSECVSVVRLPPHAEAYPGENMAAFCVNTDEKKLVFAAEKDGCGEWVEKICETAFQKGRLPQMEENQIYTSRDEVFEFQVAVEQSEASARCSLQGAYVLQVSEDVLLLREIESKQKVLEWPYKLLRRYGCDKVVGTAVMFPWADLRAPEEPYDHVTEVTFSIEAGRRCDSGPGTFIFETKQGEELLYLMELAIQQQKSLTVPGGNTSLLSPCSPLPKTPSMSSLDIYTNAGSESDSGPSKTTHRHSQPVCLEECAYAQPVDAIRSQRTAHTLKPGPCKDSEPVYSVPVDVLQSRPICGNEPPLTGTPESCGRAEPVYAEVLYYTKKKESQNKEETVYRLAEGSSVQDDVHTGAMKSKQDSPSTKEVIYSQVYKPSKAT